MYQGHSSQRWGCISYAQHYDDGMILNLINILSIPKQEPMWLDIGAHHPIDISNTALLYDKGYRGINIEANPNLMHRFHEIRSQDKNVCMGVGPENSIMTFYRFDNTSGLNTFSRDDMESHKKVFGVTLQDTVELPVKKLMTTVDEYCNGKFPPILLLDIEGLDFEVLTQLPKFSGPIDQQKLNLLPSIICVETRRERTLEMSEMLQWRGFRKYVRMGENLFFVREDLYFAHLA